MAILKFGKRRMPKLRLFAEDINDELQQVKKDLAYIKYKLISTPNSSVDLKILSKSQIEYVVACMKLYPTGIDFSISIDEVLEFIVEDEIRSLGYATKCIARFEKQSCFSIAENEELLKIREENR